MVNEKIENIKKTLPKDVELIAVSKTKPIEMIQQGLKSGHLDFGENKVKEMVNKHASLPKNIRWHMIGHLQRNKVKYIVCFFGDVQSYANECFLAKTHACEPFLEPYFLQSPNDLNP